MVVEQQTESSVRYLASVVLKNTLRNHVVALRQINNQELVLVKQSLLQFLGSQPTMNGSQEYPRKVIKEVIFVVTRVII